MGLRISYFSLLPPRSPDVNVGDVSTDWVLTPDEDKSSPGAQTDATLKWGGGHGKEEEEEAEKEEEEEEEEEEARFVLFASQSRSTDFLLE